MWIPLRSCWEKKLENIKFLPTALLSANISQIFSEPFSSDQKSGESDFFNLLFENSDDELERLSPHGGDECIYLSIPQTPTRASTSLDVSFSDGGPLQPQDTTLPSDLCDNFSQFFDSEATQLPGDLDLATLWSETSRIPPLVDTEPPTWPSASSTSTYSHDESCLDSRPVLLHSREYQKEEASGKRETDGHGRGTKRTKENNGMEIKRIKSKVKVLQRR